MMNNQNWYSLNNPEQIVSPSLLIYPKRIESNIRLMIEMVGDINLIRPHIKTHKSANIIQMQMDHGIYKFKCATITEAALLGKCGAADILLAIQPVGANISRFIDLIAAYPKSEFSAIVDNKETIIVISEMAEAKRIKVALYLDLNTGMNRTGIVPDSVAADLYKTMYELPNIMAKGFHAYDGHIRNTDFAERKSACNLAFEEVLQLKYSLEAEGIPIENIIAGGSPTFPIHAQREGVEASPGTTLLWDEQNGSSFPEMKFIPAAVLFTRIISKPQVHLACIDLGHKAIAPEMNFPRVKIFGMEHCEQTGQSEEHLVIKCPDNNLFAVGDIHYAIPMHICPTVAKYSELLTVENGALTGSWEVTARDH